MIRARRGLIVEVTEGDTLSAGGNPLTQTVKLALKGLALNMAAELQPHGVAAVAIVPGFLRSESMLERNGVTEATGATPGRRTRISSCPNRRCSSAARSPRSRRIPTCSSATGQLCSSWELAREYRFTDYDGSRPDWGAHTIDWSVFPTAFVDVFRSGARVQLQWLNTLAARTESFSAKVPGS